MLIKVFGIWLMLANVSHLEEGFGDSCRIRTSANKYANSIIARKHCDEVAAEINKQLKELNNDRN